MYDDHCTYALANTCICSMIVKYQHKITYNVDSELCLHLIWCFTGIEQVSEHGLISKVRTKHTSRSHYTQTLIKWPHEVF